MLCSFRGIARTRSGTQTTDATPLETTEADGEEFVTPRDRVVLETHVQDLSSEKKENDQHNFARMHEFETRNHSQLGDTDVANDVVRSPAAISIVRKKSKLTEWLEKFDAQHRVETRETRVPECQEPHVSPLTAWVAHFDAKHPDNSSTVSLTT